MLNIPQLSKLAELYCAKAITAQRAQSGQFVETILKKMLGLVEGALVSVKHLLSLPKYKRSSNLTNVLDSFQQIYQLLSTIDRADPTLYLDKLQHMLDDVSFYSASGNTGTGRDPTMDVQEDGYTPPSYYVNELTKLLTSLRGYMFKERQF